MLPTYHRQQDTRLLLLMFPAFAVLWSERGLIRWLALLVSAVGVVFTGDTLLMFLGVHLQGLGASTSTLSGKLLTLSLGRPAPLVLLAVGVFYLWIYIRSTGWKSSAVQGRLDTTRSAEVSNSTCLPVTGK